MQQRVILREHSVVVSSCPSRLADFSKYPLHSPSVPPARIYMLASGQAHSWFHADGRANELWGTHRHVLGGLLIKLGNNEWTNTLAASALVCAPRVSFVSSLSLPIFSLYPSPSYPPTSYRIVGCQGYVCKPRRTTVGSGTRQGHGYQALVSLSFSLLPVLLLRSYSFPFPPPAYLPSPILYNCSIFLFFFSSTSPRAPPLFFSLSLSIFPTWQPSWGMCSVIERTIQNNNKLSSPLPLTFHLLPPSSPSCNLHGLGPMRRVASHCARKWRISTTSGAAKSLFRPFLPSAIFLRPYFAILSVSPYLAMSQSERVCA